MSNARNRRRRQRRRREKTSCRHSHLSFEIWLQKNTRLLSVVFFSFRTILIRLSKRFESVKRCQIFQWILHLSKKQNIVSLLIESTSIEYMKKRTTTKEGRGISNSLKNCFVQQDEVLLTSDRFILSLLVISSVNIISKHKSIKKQTRPSR